MQDYYKVDVKRFLKDSGKWRKKITELNKLLNSDDWQENTDMDKSEIKREIERLQEYERLKSRAVKYVTQEELDCLEVLFGELEERKAETPKEDDQIQMTVDDKRQDPFKNEHSNEPVVKSIEEVMEKYGYGSKSAVYDRYYHGRDKIADFLNNNFFYDSLIDYYHFDVNSFLKDAHTWKRKIKEKQAQLTYDRSLRSIPPNAVGGRQIGKKNDPTLQEVIANDEINTDIEKYEKYIQVLKTATNILDPLQHDLIYMMFLPEGRNKYRTKGVRIEELAIKHAVSVTVAERQLRDAKSIVKSYIEKRYFGRSPVND